MFHPRAQTFATGSSMALRQHAIPLVAVLVLAATAAGVRAAEPDWSNFYTRMQSARAVLVAHFAQASRSVTTSRPASARHDCAVIFASVARHAGGRDDAFADPSRSVTKG